MKYMPKFRSAFEKFMPEADCPDTTTLRTLALPPIWWSLDSLKQFPYLRSYGLARKQLPLLFSKPIANEIGPR